MFPFRLVWFYGTYFFLLFLNMMKFRLLCGQTFCNWFSIFKPNLNYSVWLWWFLFCFVYFDYILHGAKKTFTSLAHFYSTSLNCERRKLFFRVSLRKFFFHFLCFVLLGNLFVKFFKYKNNEVLLSKMEESETDSDWRERKSLVVNDNKSGDDSQMMSFWLRFKASFCVRVCL